MFYVFIALISIGCLSALFFFNDTATTEIYTLSLHDALPIWHQLSSAGVLRRDRDCHRRVVWARSGHAVLPAKTGRSYAVGFTAHYNGSPQQTYAQPAGCWTDLTDTLAAHFRCRCHQRLFAAGPHRSRP